MEGLKQLMEFQVLRQDQLHKEMILKLDEILKSIPDEVPDNSEDIQKLGEIIRP